MYFQTSPIYIIHFLITSVNFCLLSGAGFAHITTTRPYLTGLTIQLIVNHNGNRSKKYFACLPKFSELDEIAPQALQSCQHFCLDRLTYQRYPKTW